MFDWLLCGVFNYPILWPKTPPLRHVLPLAGSIGMHIFRERFSKHWAHITLYPGDVKASAARTGFSDEDSHVAFTINE